MHTARRVFENSILKSTEANKDSIKKLLSKILQNSYEVSLPESICIKTCWLAPLLKIQFDVWPIQNFLTAFIQNTSGQLLVISGSKIYLRLSEQTLFQLFAYKWKDHLPKTLFTNKCFLLNAKVDVGGVLKFSSSYENINKSVKYNVSLFI